MKKCWLLLALLTATALAQNTDFSAPTDGEIQMLRKDVRSEKKRIVASNMILTDAEAEKFWLVYDRFATELTKMNDAKLALLKDYAQNYSILTNQQAERYLEARAAMEESAIRLRVNYIPQFRKVLSGKATALFFQIEWRANLMIELQLASQVPLIEPDSKITIPTKVTQ